MSASSVLSIIAPQFDTIANRNEYINLAELRVNRCWFREKADLAVALMAAHLITLNTTRTDGDAGTITSKREGDLSVTYAVTPSNGDSSIGMTHYGLQFKELRDECGFIFGVTGGNDYVC